MATWIAHLRLAEHLLGRIAGLAADAFAVGSIAPDSGIPDENWEKFTPPPHVSHFGAADAVDDRQRCRDLEFYRRYLTQCRPAGDPQRLSFYLGYFLHLVTDNLWMEQIVRPTKVLFAAEFEADPRFIWEVKRDWYGLDFVYLRDHPQSLFWKVFLDCSYTQDYLDFMPPQAVQQRIAHIQDYYRQHDEKIEALYARPFVYLSAAQMGQFVHSTAERLYEIYHRLWNEGVDSTAYTSALELPRGGIG